MKFIKVLIILIFIVLVAVIGLTVYVAMNGRAILLDQIEKNTGIKVQVSSLKVSFPDTIVAYDLKVSDSIKIKRVKITPSLIGFLSGQVIFNRVSLEAPEITITRKDGDNFDLGMEALKPVVKPEADKKKTIFYINKLIIRDGTVAFVDKSLVGQEPFVIKCGELKADIFRPSVLQLFRMNFDAQGKLLSKDGSGIGQVRASGWVDPINKDMESKFDINSGRLLYFALYYKQYFSKDLKSGDAAVAINAVSKKNDMSVDCNITLSNVAFVEPETQATEDKTADFSDFAFMTFDSLLGPDGNLVVDFSLRTRMDKPKFENVKFKGTFLKNRIEATFSSPKSAVQTVEDFKKVGEQFEDIGKQFKKIFKGD